MLQLQHRLTLSTYRYTNTRHGDEGQREGVWRGEGGGKATMSTHFGAAGGITPRYTGESLTCYLLRLFTQVTGPAAV